MKESDNGKIAKRMCMEEIINDDFFFNDTATTEIYTLSLHDALPIWILESIKRDHLFCKLPE